VLLVAAESAAQVLRVGDLNTRQIGALDRSRTVVFLQGGMLEEHGPHLPAFTDGIMSERLTKELAEGVAAQKPGWTALLFPPVSVGASGSNEIGGQFVFPGTYAVRPSTLRAIFMDLAKELGDQGFRWIMVVHVHGSPLHIAALDEASDFFHDAYGGRMVNLWGLLPVLGGWGKALERLTAAQKKEDGVSLHGGADEHSMMLHLRPDLVAPDFRDARTLAGASYEESFAVAKQRDWPGYIGAPRLASAELGQHIWTSFSNAALTTTLEILGGADPSKYPRYMSFLVKNPLYREWIRSATERDAALQETQRAWLAGRKSTPPAPERTDQARTASVPPRAALAAAYPEIDRLFTEFAKTAHVPGAAWGIVVDGQLAHAGAAGVRDVPSNAPVDAGTVFRIASMTKSFTAMAILKLRDEGKLSLDDPAERYVPELKNLRYPTTDSPRITIRHLLTHSEGFPEDNPWGDQQLSESEEAFSRMLRDGIPFSNAPGIAYEYSNYGFAILGRIVSRASGMDYDEYISRNILQPLGMTSTTFHPSKVPPGRLAIGYRWEDDTWKEEPALPHGAFGAMGGMLTTIRDLSRYVAALLDAWPPRDGAETGPIRRASLREMQQPWRPSGTRVVIDKATNAPRLSAGSYGYGLGVTQTCDFGAVVAHSGGLPGYGSVMRWFPDYGIGIIAFGNLTYTGWGRVVNEAVDRLMKTGGMQPRTVPPSTALVEARDAVSKLVASWDDALADKIAAENLFLDRSKDRRRKDLEDLRATVGACTAPAAFDYVENALRGQWTMSCERGKLEVAITLAPTMPPTVQYLSVRPAPAAPQRPATCAGF
jgi:CubicO group peptidase (beta-lactamase class C family)/creatinine amidohydrolase/Fe(II)-dependent formamide hydrolase-like protein